MFADGLSAEREPDGSGGPEEAIDRAITVEFRPRGLPRMIAIPLYEACRRAQGGRPLTGLAARALRQHVPRGAVVGFITGAGTAPWLPAGETDGPLGAAALARALDLALGVRPVFLVEEHHVAPVKAAAEAAELTVLDHGLLPTRPHAGTIVTIPALPGRAPAWAAGILDRYQPRALVFIERLGPNSAGYYHGVLGYGRPPDDVPDLVPLLRQAKERSILTIGIGDGGNEIGFGRVRAAVQQIQPWGAVCRCPCGQGIATVAETEITVAASISNWGAYGVAASLASQLARDDLLHTPHLERRMLQACVDAGAEDGALGRRALSVDGAPLAAGQALITLLRHLVLIDRLETDRDF